MTNQNNISNDKLSKTTTPFGNIMTSFRPLPSITEEEQEHFISVAMEATGLKRYQRWDIVEPFTLVDSMKNTWHTVLRKVRGSLAGKQSSPDAGNPTSSNEVKEGEEHKVVAVEGDPSGSGLPPSPPETKPEGKSVDDDWTLLGVD